MEFRLNEELDFVKVLLLDARKLEKKRGDFVYHLGDEPQGLYFIESGLVGLIRVSSKGQDHLLRLFKPAQFFGHRSLFSNEHYHASARCIEDSKVLYIRKDRVFAQFDKYPQAYYFVARALAKELRRAEVRSVIVSDGDVLERVAATVLLFESLYPEHMWTRSEIANFCASRTPTVIKALGQLEEKGLIKQEGRKIIILRKKDLLELTY